MLAYDRRMRRFNLEVILYALITLVLFIGDLRKSNRHHGNLSWFFSSLADIVALDHFPIVPVPGSIERRSGASPIICPRLTHFGRSYADAPRNKTPSSTR